MKATLLSKENNEAKLTMEFSAEEFENATIKAYQANKDKYEIDGFRKGKAPRSIIEKHYGETVFVEEAINTLFNQEYPKAIDELDLDIIDAPRVEFSKVTKGKDFTATVTVAVYPEVEVKDYTGIEIEKIEPKVEDEDVEKELKAMQERSGRMIDVDREAKDGDMVVIDYKGFVGEEQFEGGTADNFPLQLGSGSFIPGFEEQLIGVKKEEERDVKVTFPEEYHAENLAGKEAIFKCVVHEIKEQELPELDDEFAKDVSESDTLEDLKKEIRRNIELGKKAQAENQMKDKILEQIYKDNEISVPDVMVDEEISNMMQEFDQQLRGQGLDLNKYFEMVGKDPASFREDVKDDAFKRVKTRMLITAVADKENFEATDEEVDQQIDLMAAQYGMEADKIKEMMGVQNISFIGKDIRMKKAVDYLYEKAVLK